MADFKDNMVPAQAGGIASSAEYNKVVSNVRVVHQKNQNQDAWMTAHLDGVSQADASHATINSRLSALESGAGGVSERPILIAAQNSANLAVSGGQNLEFSIIDADNYGMWDNSQRRCNIQVPGIYEFTFQTVWNGAGGGGPSGQASTSPNIGLYVTKNGTAGGANGLAAFETFPQKEQDQTVIQATGNAVLNVGDYLTARVYAATNSNSYLRGRSHSASYGGTYFVVRMLQGLPT